MTMTTFTGALDRYLALDKNTLHYLDFGEGGIRTRLPIHMRYFKWRTSEDVFSQRSEECPHLFVVCDCIDRKKGLICSHEQALWWSTFPLPALKGGGDDEPWDWTVGPIALAFPVYENLCMKMIRDVVDESILHRLRAVLRFYLVLIVVPNFQGTDGWSLLLGKRFLTEAGGPMAYMTPLHGTIGVDKYRFLGVLSGSWNEFPTWRDVTTLVGEFVAEVTEVENGSYRCAEFGHAPGYLDHPGGWTIPVDPYRPELAAVHALNCLTWAVSGACWDCYKLRIDAAVARDGDPEKLFEMLFALAELRADF